MTEVDKFSTEDKATYYLTELYRAMIQNQGECKFTDTGFCYNHTTDNPDFCIVEETRIFLQDIGKL